MGLFDKLFKKKEQPKAEPKRQEYSSAPKEANFQPVFDLLKDADNEYERKRKEKEDKIQRAIARIPGSEKYRLEKGQTESNASILNITEFFPVDSKRFVVFDLETTGLDYATHDVVEIGAVRVENGEITAEYSTLINPSIPIPADATAVNKITNAMLQGQPKIYEALPEFLTFVGDDVLAAHNVRFDYSFLSNACMNSRFKVPEKYFDTMALTRYYPEAGSRKLTALAEAAGVEIETAHRALSDARMTAKLILATNEKRKKKTKK